MFFYICCLLVGSHTSAASKATICIFSFCANVKVKGVREPAVQSALRKLPEQGFRLAVFEIRDEVDLEDLGESLRQSRRHKVFPVQREREREIDEGRLVWSLAEILLESLFITKNFKNLMWQTVILK